MPLANTPAASVAANTTADSRADSRAAHPLCTQRCDARPEVFVKARRRRVHVALGPCHPLQQQVLLEAAAEGGAGARLHGARSCRRVCVYACV